MLILVIVLLMLWLILAIVGFAIKGLLWLAIIGIVLFVGTAAIGAVRRRASAAKRDVPGVDSANRNMDSCRLPDGTPVRLRAVVGTDRQVLQDMYAAMSQVSRRGRFHAA